MTKPNAKRICRHFGVAQHKLNQDLNAGFLIECIPLPRKGMPRRWDEKAFIATHFYFDFQKQGMSRRNAGKIATAIAMFADINPGEDYCATVRREGEYMDIVKIGEVPAPKEWGSEILSATFFNIMSVRKTYRKEFSTKT